MLLPPDLRDWIPEDDMVHFVIEAVEGMHLGNLRVNRHGSGSQQYPPKMMLTLLIYCYANGIFSSRRIERATYRDIAVRFLTADTHPDHDTICAFRRANFEAMTEAFLHVLHLARSMGVLKVGTISVDGTHIKANASKDKNVRYDRAGELDRQLGKDIQLLMDEAERTDRRDDDDGQSLPDEIARRQRLRAKMQQARADLEARAKARAEAQHAELQEKSRRKKQQGCKTRDRKIQPPKQTPEDREQANLTDADSRLMRKNIREGYTQSYNGQAAVDADGSQLVLSNHVSQSASDANELERAVNNVPESIGKVNQVLADAGYVNADAIERLQAQGHDLYVAVGRDDGNTKRRYDYRPKSATDKPGRKVKDPRLRAMQRKLKTEAGKTAYAKRKQTVEPVFGIIKQVMGYRQTLLRGVEKVRGEWNLVCLAYNVKRLWVLQAV
jgi:transposase